MWTPIKLCELRQAQFPIVGKFVVPTTNSTLRAWRNGKTILCHEHSNGKSYLRSYLTDGTSLQEWPQQGWPTVTKNKISFEKYSTDLVSITSNFAGLHFLKSKKSAPRFIVLSMHGGPESIELDEVRYGGWYEDVIKRGGAVAIWNYPGSTGFGALHRTRPHKTWVPHLRRCLYKVIDRIQDTFNISESQIILFGPSFGGTLAEHLSGGSTFMGKILLNPVIDIKAHAQRAKLSGEYGWFQKRFDLKANELSADLLTPTKVTTVFLVSTHDEIVDTTITKNYVQNAQSRGLPYCLKSLKNFKHVARSQNAQSILRDHLGKSLELLLQNKANLELGTGRPLEKENC